MKKIAVVFWSGTGNTEVMAETVKTGAEGKGASVELFRASDFDKEKVSQFDGIAFGCPAMGAEVLEEEEFEPMFASIESELSGKAIALFGSYGWGDGQWMREWEERCRNLGANLVADGVMANEAPDDEALENCKNLGELLA